MWKTVVKACKMLKSLPKRQVYHFMDLIKGDKGADTDTDLALQFCLPYDHQIKES